MSHVLVVEDSPTQAKQIRFLLEDAGFLVEHAADGREALAAIARNEPAVVLTDLHMPNMNGLELVEKVRSDYPFVPVILMTAYGSDEIAAEALKRGAVSYVPKKFLARDVIPTLERAVGAACAAEDLDRARDGLDEVNLSFALANDVTLIPAVLTQLEEVLGWLRLCDQTAVIRVTVALREALMNAVLRGNLELSARPCAHYEKSYQEMLEEHNQGGMDEMTFYLSLVALHDLVEQRRAEEPYRGRRVFVRASLSRARAEFCVRDEGPGFDPSPWCDPAKSPNLEEVRGRGLLLIRTFMDEVRHNDRGNEITLTKHADRPPQARGANGQPQGQRG